MNLSKRNKVIKAETVAIVDHDDAASAEFMRMQYESADEPDDVSHAPKLSKAERERLMYEAVLNREKKASYQQGYDEGLKKGIEMQKQDASHMVQALADAVREVDLLKQQILEGAEQDIVGLAYAIAEKVVHQEVQTNRDVIKAVLTDAIKSIVDKEELKIRLNPQDYRYMLEIKADFFQAIDGVKHIILEEDDKIMRGGAVIESLFGEVDARVDRQLGEMKALLSGNGT
jgi:flagellar assembly protein FliH